MTLLPPFYKFLPRLCVRIFIKGVIEINAIYIDVLFMVNMAINTGLLLCTGYILKLPFRALRILIASIVASIYSCIAFVLESGTLNSLIMRFLFAALIVSSAFGVKNVFSVIKHTFAFVGITILTGVAFLGILYFSGLGIRLGGVIRNGIFYFDIPSHYMVLCTVVTFSVICILEKLIKKNSKRSFIRIKLYRFGRAVELKALIDTGNMLSDPLSGRKVIIAEAKTLSPLFDFDMESLGKETLPEGFRLIPYSSIGQKNGLLAAFVPDTVEIESTQRNNMIAAVFDGTLSESGDYNALIGPV